MCEFKALAMKTGVDPIPRPIPPDTYFSSKLRIVPIDTDGMEPTFMRGDCAVILPVTRFDQDGLYAVSPRDGAITVIRATYQYDTKNVRIRRDNELYNRHGDQFVDIDWFNKHIVGLVVADIKVREAGVLQTISA